MAHSFSNFNKAINLLQLRNKTQSDIYNLISEYPHHSIKITNPPEKPKVIISVANMNIALELQQHIKTLVNEYNAEFFGSGGARNIYPLHYNIKIITTTPQICINITNAKQSSLISGSQLLTWLNHFNKQSLDVPPETIKQIIKPQNTYTLSQYTGASYRCSYFDYNLNKRCQTHIGDVLIAVSSETVQVNQKLERKVRKDKKIPLLNVTASNKIYTIFN